MTTLTRLLLLSWLSDGAPAEPEPLPTAEAWSDEPLCPLWGPMEGFYREGVETGRVGLIKETMMIYWYFLSIWDAGGYKTSSPSCQTWQGGAGVRSTASTTSTTLSTGRPTTGPSCQYFSPPLLAQYCQTDNSDKWPGIQQSCLFRGDRPRSESGEISIGDIRDSNLLSYSAETGNTAV